MRNLGSEAAEEGTGTALGVPTGARCCSPCPRRCRSARGRVALGDEPLTPSPSWAPRGRGPGGSLPGALPGCDAGGRSLGRRCGVRRHRERPRKGKTSSCLAPRGRGWGAQQHPGRGSPRWVGVPVTQGSPPAACRPPCGPHSPSGEAPRAPLGLAGRELWFPRRDSAGARSFCEAHNGEKDEAGEVSLAPALGFLALLPASLPAGPHPEPGWGELSPTGCPAPPLRWAPGGDPWWGMQGGENC